MFIFPLLTNAKLQILEICLVDFRNKLISHYDIFDICKINIYKS